jgi:hypothetical protein
MKAQCLVASDVPCTSARHSPPAITEVICTLVQIPLDILWRLMAVAQQCKCVNAAILNQQAAHFLPEQLAPITMRITVTHHHQKVAATAALQDVRPLATVRVAMPHNQPRQSECPRCETEAGQSQARARPPCPRRPPAVAAGAHLHAPAHTGALH